MVGFPCGGTTGRRSLWCRYEPGSTGLHTGGGGHEPRREPESFVMCALKLSDPSTFAWRQPTYWRCPRCGQIVLTVEAGVRCPTCLFVEGT